MSKEVFEYPNNIWLTKEADTKFGNYRPYILTLVHEPNLPDDEVLSLVNDEIIRTDIAAEVLHERDKQREGRVRRLVQNDYSIRKSLIEFCAYCLLMIESMDKDDKK